ncbi:MAG: immunoglobulin domain-containing protein [Verrucomicrobiae bacterium]|nr:immunoglobulin domain-containing protein [Verrucomicrobiae bacterium]
MKPGRVRTFRLAGSVALAASLLPGAAALAATYRVGPTRTYTNLQAVVSRLLPGDVVEVDGDATYPGNVTFDRPGTAAEPIVIRGVRVNGRRPVISGVNGFSGGAVVRFRADHYVFEGFEVTGGGDPLTARGIYNLADQVTVRDCVVRDCPTGVSGAAVAGSFTLRGVEIYNCGSGTTGHQVYVASDNTRHPDAVFRMEFCYLHDAAGGNNVKSRVGRNEIYFNWIEGALYHELDLIGADPTEQAPGTADLVREDSDVVGNVFYKLPTSSGSVARCGSDGLGSSNGRFRFVHNTMVLHPDWAASWGVFKLQGARQSVEMHNNVIYHGGTRVFMIRNSDLPSGSPDGVTGSRNWVPTGSTGMPAGWTNTIFGTDPGFTDVAGFDFTPTATSLLRNAAQLPTTSPAAFPFPAPLQEVMFLPPPRALLPPGTLRVRPVNGAPDIGAFEHSGTAPPVVHQPVITAHPVSQQVNAGTDVIFSAAAEGTPPLRWQWRFNGTNLPGATNATLVLSNAQPAQAGRYSAVVTNLAGEARTEEAVLSFNVPPAILVPPASRTNLVGATATFWANATGTPPLSYQWRFNGQELAGATGTNFVIPLVQFADAGEYTVQVSNVAGSVVSPAALLVVWPDTNRPGVFIAAPPSNARLSNDTVTVSGTASDNVRVAAVLCQWNDPNGPFVPATGASSWQATFRLQPGTNTVRVKSLDVMGNESAVATRRFFYVTLSPLTVRIQGEGRVMPELDGALLEVGRSYQITALPGSNQVFTGWSGDVTATQATLTFLMQSNLMLQANFAPNPFLPVRGVYSGLFAEPGGARHASAGFFTLTLNERGSASGRLSVDGNSFSFTAKFDLDGRAGTTVSRSRVGKSPLRVELDLDLADALPGGDQIFGSVIATNWQAALRGHRHVWSAANPATAFSNSYTFILPRRDDGSGPGGDGYGLVSVDALGRVKLSGAAGDGAALSQGATLSPSGEWPLYAALYVGALPVTNGASVTTTREFKGSLWGWISLAGGAPEGSLTWTRTDAATNRYFARGFTNVVAVWGSRWLPPPAGERALALTHGTVTLSGGNLPAPLTNHFVLTTNHVFEMTATAHPMRLFLNPRNGQLKGAFVHPANPLVSTPLNGAALQSANLGRGLFLGTNAAGGFVLP